MVKSIEKNSGNLSRVSKRKIELRLKRKIANVTDPLIIKVTRLRQWLQLLLSLGKKSHCIVWIRSQIQYFCHTSRTLGRNLRNGR